MNLEIFNFEERVIPLDEWITTLVDWLVENHREFFQAIKWPVEQTLTGLDNGLNAAHPLIIIIAVGFLAWKVSSVKLAVF